MKSYRGYKKDTPMSSWGHAMFNDDATGLAEYGEILYSVDKDDLTDINDLMDGIIEQLENADEEVHMAIASWDVYDLFNPDDMVICAGAYDNDVLFNWFWETIIESNNIAGVATVNGAIVFDESLIKVEGIAAEIEIAQ